MLDTTNTLPVEPQSATDTSPPSRRSSPGAKQLQRTAVSRAVLVPVILLVLVSIAGAPYYLGSLGDRVRSPLHAWLRPSGYVGQSAGILTFAGFLFMWLYPLRKKWRRLSFSGSVPRWLDVHIVVGLTLPLLGAVHAGWRFTGVIGIGYWAMFLVALSGVIGRYIYVRIPRSKAGLELGMEDIATSRRQLLVQLAGTTGLEVEVVQSVLATDPVPSGVQNPVRLLAQMVRDDFARRRAVNELRRRWKALGPGRPQLDGAALREVRSLARRQMSLGQQLRLLESTQRVFGYWHAAHKPVAITALLAVLIHVTVVVALGATWFY
jgi:hypothetical protein